jgi:hypothetical protein
MDAHAHRPLLNALPMLLPKQEQYLEVTTPVPEAAVLFGAGEHISATGLELRRDGAPLTLWTRDCAAADPDQNTYGAWPFVLDVRPGARACAVCLFRTLSHRTTGACTNPTNDCICTFHRLASWLCASGVSCSALWHSSCSRSICARMRVDRRVIRAPNSQLNGYVLRSAWLKYKPCAPCPAGGAAHGVLLLNSNGQDILATNSSLSWRAIGGVLDFFFFLGPTPLAVLEQLTSVVGRPMMVPYWSLGLMNSKCAPETSSKDPIMASWRVLLVARSLLCCKPAEKEAGAVGD